MRGASSHLFPFVLVCYKNATAVDFPRCDAKGGMTVLLRRPDRVAKRTRRMTTTNGSGGADSNIRTLPNDVMVYTGPSMHFTLRRGDLLHVKAYAGGPPREGDVIIFRAPEDDRNIVHRVVHVDRDGAIRTRGDNNSQVDPWELSSADIVGKVVYASSQGRKRRIRGGFVGRIAGRIMLARRRSRRAVLRRLQPAYRRLAGLPILRRRVAPLFEPRVVSYRRGDGSTELHLLLGARIIGRLAPGHSEWRIKAPYRFVVDESALPTLGSSSRGAWDLTDVVGES